MNHLFPTIFLKSDIYRSTMWVTRVQINGEKALIGSRTKKFKVVVSGYPVSFYEQKKGIYLYLVGFLFGEERNKKQFVDDLKKDKRVLYLENNNDFLIGKIREPLKFKQLYHHEIIHLEPIVIDKEGVELWTMGSWDKKELMNFIQLVQKTHAGKLLSIKEEKITHFSVVSMWPELTDKQRKALQLAIENGYYHYPREIELETLAKMMKVSYSTYQAHLRKAEQKLIPFFFNRVK